MSNLTKKEANHDDLPLRLLIILIIPHGRFEVLDDGFQRLQFRWRTVLKQLCNLIGIYTGDSRYVRSEDRIC